MADNHRVLNDSGDWVEFKPNGYPYSLRKKLREVFTDEDTFPLMLPFVVSCSIKTLDGGDPITTLTSLDQLDRVEEVTATNIIRTFYAFRNERMQEPLPKVP